MAYYESEIALFTSSPMCKKQIERVVRLFFNIVEMTQIFSASLCFVSCTHHTRWMLLHHLYVLFDAFFIIFYMIFK